MKLRIFLLQSILLIASFSFQFAGFDYSGCVVSNNPLGPRNGRCEDIFNTASCNWDGGDCCPETCPDGLRFLDVDDDALQRL